MSGAKVSNVIPSPYKCQVCGVATWFSEDSEGGYWCEEHQNEVPRAKWTPSHHLREEWRNYQEQHPEPELTHD